MRRRGARVARTTPRPSPRAYGLLAGVVADHLFADPARGHPVAGFGTVAGRVERAVWAPSRVVGAAYTAGCVAASSALGATLEALASRRASGGWQTAVTAAGTWTALGGTSLARTATELATALERGDLATARQALPGLCGRDPAALDEADLVRATVESVAENTSDAVVGALFWGAVAGLPGLLGYRAANTLDAMVGHRSPRYERFGWASARLDDVANLVPARLTAALVVLCAPVVGGSPRRAAATWRRYGHAHPSPNSGHCEAAFAGALGVRLGGRNVYSGRIEHRPVLGDRRPPAVADIHRAVRLSRAVCAAAAGLAAAGVAVRETRGRRRHIGSAPGPAHADQPAGRSSTSSTAMPSCS